jgi:DNA-directed RNA polymerase specialized sigma24 family protein
MSRILDFFLDRNKQTCCTAYSTSDALFEGLKTEKTTAIQCLYTKISGPVFNLGKNYHLKEEDIEELICDCITFFLQKIKIGDYVYQGFEPSTYVIEVAKNKVKNVGRNNAKHLNTELHEASMLIIAEEPEFTNLEAVNLIDKLIAQLKPSCQNLIRLKYLEEVNDKDAIEQKLTQYSTVNALKSHRAQCMKKLTEIAAANSNKD